MTPTGPTASLFGVSGKSNRDSARKSHWGKNEFNSSFPVALLCYMAATGRNPIYVKLGSDLNTYHDELGVEKLFGIDPLASGAYYSFEDSYTPYQSYVSGQLPRSDVVIMNREKTKKPWMSAFEVKLTALPDNATHKMDEEKYSCEMVFRPTAIVHLALNIAHTFRADRSRLAKIISPTTAKIFNWRRPDEVMHLTADVMGALNKAFKELLEGQEPFIIQPIWKTMGKKCILEENCLDVFVWSNFAFTRLFFDMCDGSSRRSKKMTRQQRCVFWLMRMLNDYAQGGVINPSLITSEMAYELQTDKAFSASGRVTRKYLHSEALESPRIQKEEIREIILHGGHEKLSPERRFDAAIVNTPGLF